MKGLFGYEIPDNDTKEAKKAYWAKYELSNPMVRAYGRNKDPMLKCKDCRHLFFKQYSNRYYKCAIRGCSASEATDHRKFWPACTKFEPVDNHEQ